MGRIEFDFYNFETITKVSFLYQFDHFLNQKWIKNSYNPNNQNVIETIDICHDVDCIHSIVDMMYI